MTAGLGAPAGGVYEWYQRGRQLLEEGNAAAAAQLLARAAEAAPDSRAALEALARAQAEAGRTGEATGSFRRLVEADPADDYARFALGLVLGRGGDAVGAVEQLALAAAMRPEREDYARALRAARATLHARSAPSGPS